jgi:hypothetical protein
VPRRFLKAAGAIALLCFVLGGVFFKPLVVFFMSPSGPFDPAQVPPAPSYKDAAAWSALPDRQDAADVAISALPALDQRSAPADVFYAHPTTYIGNRWNGPVLDARLGADTDRVATKLQASAFNACCAIYAPRYRQANGTAFTRPSQDGERAIDLAFSDVAAAFRYYLQHKNHGRPFILAAHSQGSVLAYRLLRQEISGKPPRDLLVAAYVVGAAIPEDIKKELPDVPVCATPEQTRCIIGWNARSPQYVPGGFEMTLQKTTSGTATEPRLCVNPLSFRTDGALAGVEMNQGALFFDSASPAVLPGFASAQCKDGTLLVPQIGKPPRDFMSRLLDHVLGEGNYHPIE